MRRHFEDKPYEDEKEGTKYVLIEDDDFTKGTVVVLYQNDESRFPFFHIDGDKDNKACLYWRNLGRLNMKATKGGIIFKENE